MNVLGTWLGAWGWMHVVSTSVSLYVRCVECRSRICMTVLIMSQPSNRISKNEDGAHISP